MRNAFASELTELAQEDDRVVLLAADIGNRLFDDFKAKCPHRFYNCGVAEANMISMAAGLASEGLRPICYTITPFITYRCYEQIRVDVCYHHVPVIIVGTGSGLSYASLGATHHSCEDIAVLRALPHMTVFCPGDAWEVRAGLRAAIDYSEPLYFRLGKKGEPLVHKQLPHLKIGRANLLRPGSDVCLLSTGNLLPVAVETAKLLEKEHISAQVVSFHTVKPLDLDCLEQAFSKFPLVATIEEHSILGGLGGSVAEWLCQQESASGRLICIGTADTFLHEAGEQEDAREIFGLTPEAISRKLMARLQVETPAAGGIVPA